METKLARISQLSKENPDMVFTSLGHLINKEMLTTEMNQMQVLHEIDQYDKNRKYK